MNHKETLALYEKGRNAWNDWALSMLEKRRQLEATYASGEDRGFGG
jgi:hypothetical protein